MESVSRPGGPSPPSLGACLPCPVRASGWSKESYLPPNPERPSTQEVFLLQAPGTHPRPGTPWRVPGDGTHPMSFISFHSTLIFKIILGDNLVPS